MINFESFQNFEIIKFYNKYSYKKKISTYFYEKKKISTKKQKKIERKFFFFPNHKLKKNV